jgi:hypothetical protein
VGGSVINCLPYLFWLHRDNTFIMKEINEKVLEKQAYKMTLLLKKILGNEEMKENDKHTLSQLATNSIIFLLDLRKHFKGKKDD